MRGERREKNTYLFADFNQQHKPDRLQPGKTCLSTCKDDNDWDYAGC